MSLIYYSYFNFRQHYRIFKTGDLLSDCDLKTWNLKPRSRMKEFAVIWNNSKNDWQQYTWEIKQCELDNLELPQVLDCQLEKFQKKMSVA